MKRSPALIVFCREPVAGITKTRLIPHLGARKTADLADAFINDALAKASKLSPSRLVIAGAAEPSISRSAYFRKLARRFDADLMDQGGGSLGARMERCLAPFADGSGALLIGTDLPSLPIGALRRLNDLLQRRKVVLGPALDGGYYAIGVRGVMPPIFSGIRWSSRQVFEETVRRLERAGRSAAIGPVWHDIDRWSDIRLLCSYLSHVGLKEDHPCPATARVLRRLGLLARRG